MSAPTELKIKAVIGFSGKVLGGLSYTPCGKYFIYPLGSFVVIKNIKTEKEAFLDGHTNEVSCIAISADGTKLASGQKNLTGVKADAIIWNLTEAKKLLDAGRVMIGDDCKVHRLRQHLGEVKGLSFSQRNDYLATIGGQDDNALVVWHVGTGEAICGSPAGADSVLAVKWVNTRNDRIVTAGYYHIKVWQVDFRQPKLHAIDVKLGTLRRIFTCLDVHPDDAVAYVGSNTGDVVKVKIERDEIRSYNDPDTTIPVLVSVSKERVAKGIKCVRCVINDVSGNVNIILGAGDGTLAYMNPSLNFVKGKSCTLMGGITSISQHCVTGVFAVGTDQCNRYSVHPDDLGSSVASPAAGSAAGPRGAGAGPTLLSSCHFGSVNDVCYPPGCADLVVTSSVQDIRVWNIKLRQELLRIQVPNLECLCCIVSLRGTSLISGWDDGKIRCFYPETGRLKFVIADAHSERVTSLAMVDSEENRNWRLISGGSEGRVRIWNVTPTHQALLSSLKEHRGPVNCIRITRDASQFITASSDGSCIVWDLQRYCRVLAFFEPTVFECVLYHPDESQMLTVGSNHKISYWDATDGTAIRVLEGGDEGMTSVDISPSGEFFISGGADKQLKVWHYDEGLCVAAGRAHSGAIRSVKLSPDGSSIVSVGSTGEIIFWEMPSEAELRRGLVE